MWTSPSDADREAAALPWLDEAERARLAGITGARRRRQFLLCRAALRAWLCAELGCRNDRLSFRFNAHGKPRALVDGAPAAIDCNLAHGGEHGLLALSPGPVGVDVEVRREGREFGRIARRVFAPAEQAVLASRSAAARVACFYRFWSLKEALIKARGTGFAVPPASFELPASLLAGARSGRFRFPDREEPEWVLHDLGEARFAAAAARAGGVG